MSQVKIRNLIKKNLKKIRKAKILCIGDIVLDKYIHGSVNRISPEAPIPILLVNNERCELGGVGNVARNIVSLGGNVKLISISGQDEGSKKIRDLIKNEKKIKDINIKVPNFHLPIKTRYISNSAHMIRVDNEDINFKLSPRIKDRILQSLQKNIQDSNAVVLSDYNKGLFDDFLLREIIDICKKNKKLILADPKKKNLDSYAGVDVLTPNLNELQNAISRNLSSEKEIIDFSRMIIEKSKIQEILLTRSEKGLTIIDKRSAKNFSAVTKKVYDVTGAGDTIISVFALMKSININSIDSAIISNHAAGIVVSKPGTAVTNIQELIK